MRKLTTLSRRYSEIGEQGNTFFRVMLAALICLMAAVSTASAQNDAAFVMVQANAAYEEGDYVGAIGLYESLIASEVTDAALYINLGNAYYETGGLGPALINYRRAEQIIPRDPDVNANLTLVRSQRVDVQGDEVSPIDSLAALTTGAVTLRELSWAVFALWALWFLLLALSILRKGSRDSFRVPLMLVGVVLLAGCILLGSRLYASQYRPAAVVLAGAAPAMSGPGEQFLQMYELHEATELRLLEISDDDAWVRFVLPDGREGWILSTAVAVI